jgi:RimJ/RimL family protein N-acetyltransferase
MSRQSKGPRPLELSTDRFVLRPISPWRFARRTLHWTRDRQAFADLTWPTGKWTLWRWWRHLRKHSRKNRICLEIWPKAGNEPIGLHLAGFDRTGNVTIGVFVADRSWWGKGVVAEVREAVLADCFVRLEAARVVGWVNGRNFASIYNYQKLGFVSEAVLREHAVLFDGARTDYLGFGLLRSEWLKRANGPIVEARDKD